MSHLAQYNRDLLKDPHYGGHIHQLRPYYRQLPALTHITTVPNTIITCTLCRGARIIANRHYNGIVTYDACPNCKKTGLMSNKQEAGGSK